MKKYKNVCIIGYKCTGKSFVAGLLGKKIGWKVYELDKIIQKEEDKSIRKITNNYTDYKPFRELVYKKLKELINEENVIIDCNEGVAVNNVTGKDEYDLLKDGSPETLKVLVTTKNNILADKLKKKLYKEKPQSDKNDTYMYLKKEFELFERSTDRYEDVADLQVKFSTYANIMKIVNKLQTEKIILKK